MSLWQKARRFLGSASLYLGLGVIFLVGCLASDVFLTVDNQRDVLRAVSNMGILAVGMTFVILTAGIDLSVGRLLGLTSTITAMLLMERTWTTASWIAVPCMAIGGVMVGVMFWSLAGRFLGNKPSARLVLSAVVGVGVAGALVYWGWRQVPTGFNVWGVLIAVPAVGLLLGAISGVTTAKGGLQPFVATLAMMISAYGLGRLIAGGGGRVHPLYFPPEDAARIAGNYADPAFEFLRYRIFDVVPVPALIFLAVAVVSHIVLSTQRFGRQVYAVGGNEEAARLSGIPVDRVKIATYAICGFLAGLVGVLFCAQYQQGKPDAGGGAELDAIAAAVIGGTSLMGGRGRITGTVVGVLIFGYLSNIFTLIGWRTDLQLALKGVIIVLAVLLQEGQFARWARDAGRSIVAVFRRGG